MAGTLAGGMQCKTAAFFRENGLSLALAGAFPVCLLAQALSGLAAFNEELREHGRATLELGEYLRSGHFLEAVFENWESEFLQMAVFVLLTARLFQRGSSESKKLEGDNESDADPREKRKNANVPWPVRKGGWVLKVYEHTLSLEPSCCFFS